MPAPKEHAYELHKGQARPGYYIAHPNRDKATSKATRAVVVLLLLVSVALVLIVTLGGWDALEGAKMVQIAFMFIYVAMAVLVARWNRGILPVAAALAVILLIFAAVSGPLWFDRDKEGFTDPAIDEGVLGLITYLLIPVQVLLVGFAMRGFQQAWNVEVERPLPGTRPGAAEAGSPSAQPA